MITAFQFGSKKKIYKPNLHFDSENGLQEDVLQLDECRVVHVPVETLHSIQQYCSPYRTHRLTSSQKETLVPNLS